MIVTLDMSNEKWTVSEYSGIEQSFVVNFGFTADTLPVFFHNLNFGCRLVSDDEVVFEKNYPIENVTYISTDQEYIESFSIVLEYDKEHSLYLWATDQGKLYEHNMFLGTMVTPNEPLDPEAEKIGIESSYFVKLTEDPETDNYEGRMYHNTVDNSIRVYKNGVWEQVYIEPTNN
jgi:hypothetical protein